jgi:hypothetical protein
MHSAAKPARGGALEAHRAIEQFLKTTRQPVLLEPGGDPIPEAAEISGLPVAEKS